MDCAWAVVCKGPAEAALLHFTAFDTETGHDFVTLYDGAREAAAADQLDPTYGRSTKCVGQLDSRRYF
jgi:hypothetical protein